jgi:hypothetical protein
LTSKIHADGPYYWTFRIFIYYIPSESRAIGPP